MDKEIVLDKIKSLAQAFNGEYTRATLVEYVYNSIIELTGMLKTFKDENPEEIDSYNALVFTAINGFGAVYTHWVEANQGMPEVMVLPLGDFQFGNCLIDAWISSVKELRKLEMAENAQNKLESLYSDMQQIKSSGDDGGGGGCFGVLILLITGAASLIGLTCWGISHLFA